MKSTITQSIFTLLLSGIVSVSFAQSQLEVKCFNNASLENGIFINGDIVEYATCNTTSPGFYVGIIDPSDCSAWGTNYNGANPDHSFGNVNDGVQSPCRQRVEHFFVFEENDSLQLAGMLNMLQQIPNGHSIIIYTPESYDFTAVSAVNSNLTDELSSRWDPSVIEGNSIMVLYGEQGVSGSYLTDTNLVDDHITFTHTVCNVMGLTEEHKLENLLLKVEGNSLFLNPDLNIDQISVMDVTGRQIPFVKNENVLTLSQSVSTGVYMFNVEIGKKAFHSKMMLSF